MSENMKRFCLFVAWLIALFATLATLYASEIANMPVCHLCWYQRVVFYPLAIILGIAVFRDDRKIGIYAIPLLVIGALFALYQYFEQLFPNLTPINFCTAGPICSDVTFRLFGFMTFPLLSFLAAILMGILLFFAKRD